MMTRFARRIPRSVMLAGFAMISAVVGTTGLAQTPTSQAPAEQGAAEEERPLLIPPGEHMVTDSKAYYRFRRPSQCTWTMRRAQHFYWRDKRRDTMSVLTPPPDTLPTAVKEVAIACLGAIDAATLPVAELPDLGLLYGRVGWVDRLDAIEARIAAADPAAQVNVWYRYGTGLNADDHPAMNERKMAVVDRLTGLGELGAYYAFKLSFDLASKYYWDEELQKSIEVFRKAQAIYSKMSKDDQLDEVFELSRLYNLLFEAAYWLDMKDSARAINAEAEKTLLPLRPAGSMQHSLLSRYIEIAKQKLQEPDKVAPQLVSDWRFNAGDATTVYPRPGVLTLVVFVDANAGASSLFLHSAMKEIDAAYGDRGLEIVYVTGTSGWFRDRTAPDDESEVEAIREYFQNHVGFKGPLLASLRARSRRFDGKLIPEPDQNFTAYGSVLNIVGRDGKIIFGENPQGFIGRRTIRLIQKEIENTSAPQ